MAMNVPKPTDVAPLPAKPAKPKKAPAKER